jgi:hypothetical protein
VSVKARSLFPLILAAALLAGACSPVEVNDFMDAYGGGTELSDPANDPDVQAAGETIAAAEEERQVAELMTKRSRSTISTRSGRRNRSGHTILVCRSTRVRTRSCATWNPTARPGITPSHS